LKRLPSFSSTIEISIIHQYKGVRESQKMQDKQDAHTKIFKEKFWEVGFSMLNMDFQDLQCTPIIEICYICI